MTGVSTPPARAVPPARAGGPYYGRTVDELHAVILLAREAGLDSAAAYLEEVVERATARLAEIRGAHATGRAAS